MPFISFIWVMVAVSIELWYQEQASRRVRDEQHSCVQLCGVRWRILYSRERERERQREREREGGRHVPMSHQLHSQHLGGQLFFRKKLTFIGFLPTNRHFPNSLIIRIPSTVVIGRIKTGWQSATETEQHFAPWQAGLAVLQSLLFSPKAGEYPGLFKLTAACVCGCAPSSTQPFLNWFVVGNHTAKMCQGEGLVIVVGCSRSDDCCQIQGVLRMNVLRKVNFCVAADTDLTALLVQLACWGKCLLPIVSLQA